MNAANPNPILAFVHINKTAGTSVKFILRNSFGLRHCDAVSHNPDGVFSAEDLRFALYFFPGLRSLSGHPLRHPSLHLPPGPLYFAFLRRPLERAASQFQQFGRGDWQRRRKYRRAGGRVLPSFEEFVSSPRWRNLQTQRIAGSEDLALAKREIEQRYLMVGLTERFDDSVRLLARLSPYPLDLRYRRLKVAPSNELKQRLLGDPATRKLLEEANQLDQALYDWVRDVHFPALLERAGDLSGLAAVEIHESTPRVERSRWWNRSVYKVAARLRAAA